MLQRSLLILGIIREVIVCKLLLAEKNQAAVIFVMELDRCMPVKGVTELSQILAIYWQEIIRHRIKSV